MIAVEASEKMATVATQVHFPVCNSIYFFVSSCISDFSIRFPSIDC